MVSQPIVIIIHNKQNNVLHYFIDIDECTKHISGCTQSCSNTEGSYMCSCYTGFTLNSNGKTCNGEI